uniref:PiggyBac transposable elementderived protein 3like [Hydra vulgaris] n=1 Tax=Lepeophtheirus salmonis TaxID=72036 RepID=A0A0K2U657_LEPSM
MYSGQRVEEDNGKYGCICQRECRCWVLKWFNPRAVHIIFSMNACHDTVMVNCRKKGNSKELQIPCPTVVKLYNTHMGGVDKADQLVSLESGAENLPLNSTCAYTLIISNRR